MLRALVVLYFEIKSGFRNCFYFQFAETYQMQ